MNTYLVFRPQPRGFSRPSDGALPSAYRKSLRCFRPPA